MVNPADFYMDVIDGRVNHVGHVDHSKTKKLYHLSKYDMYKKKKASAKSSAHDEDDDEPGNDSSALVLWEIDSNGNNVILLPKRYYVYKHFSTLSGKNYVRISNESSGNSNNFLFSSFI